MKYTRNAFGSIGILAAFSYGLTACDWCGNKNCDACVSQNYTTIHFDLDSLQSGFRRAEISGAYAVRYLPPGFATPLDTARQNRAENAFYPYFLGLDNLSWPSQLGSQPPPKAFTGYNYRLVLPNANRTYDLSDFELKSRVSEGCCACPFNVRRRFVLNGQPVVADGAGAQSVTVLRR